MEKFQYGTAAVRKHIHIPVQGIQMAGTDGTAQAVNALAQVYWIAAHYKAVAFIQVEHDFFEDKGRNFLKIEKHGGFRMVTYFRMVTFLTSRRCLQKSNINYDWSKNWRNHPKFAVFHVKLQGSNFASSSSVQSVLRLPSAYSSHLSGFTRTISQLPNREYMTALSTAPSSVLLKR